MSNNKTSKITKSLPFNTYDFFGYLIPGSTFLIICLVTDYWLIEHINKINISSHTPFYTAINTLFNEYVINNAGLTLLYILLGIIASYVLGHVVSSISSFSIDRILINKGYNYPLLTLTKQNIEINGLKKRVRGSFTFLNIIFLIIIISLLIIRLFPYMVSENSYLNIHIAAALILTILLIFTFFYITGTVSRTNKFFKILSKLYNEITKRIGFFTGTRKTLPDEIVVKFKNFTERNFDSSDYSTSDLYWLCYCYVVDKSDKLHSHLVNWLHLYSYARNISTAIYLSTVYFFYTICINTYYGYKIDIISYYILLVLFISSFIMLARFYYLYVSYYSKFLIRSCVYLGEEN